MHAARHITRALALTMLACATLCAAALCAVPAYAAETPGATSVVDPSTADDYASILGEDDPNTLNSGRVWADKSIYTQDTTLDGVTVANDGDFLVVFSALGSSIAKEGPGLSGTPTSPIAGTDDALTFTDPLGQYMEPTGDVTLVQFGQSYRFTRTGDTGDAMNFAPAANQTIVNQSYGDANVTFSLSDISIMAKRDAQAGNWTMSIRIPANALPLNVATIYFGAPDAQGRYVYIAFEHMPSSPIEGMTYDGSIYTIIVEARPDSSGKIETTLSLLRNGAALAPGQGIEFVNAYDAAAIGMNIQGSKQLDGATLFPGMFSFVIEAVRGTGVGADGTIGPISCPLPSQTTVTCNDGGAFAFPTIMLRQAGEFVYRVRELIPAAGGRPASYAYDGCSYLVTITVRHTGTGPLRAEMTLARVSEDGATTPASSIAFRNSVIPPALVVTKSQSVNGSFASTAIDVKAGDTITYRIKLKNPSGIAAKDILLYDEIPAGLLLADFAAGANGPYLHDGKLHWIITELAAGASFLAEFAVTVPAAPAGTIWHNGAEAAYPSPLDANKVLLAQSADVAARFAVEPVPAPTPAPAPDQDVTGTATLVNAPARTGDNTVLWPFVVIALLALVGVIVFRRLRYKPNDWRDHDSRDHR